MSDEIILKIKELKESGLNKVEVAKQLGFSRTTVHKYWDADYSDPDTGELEASLESRDLDVGKVKKLALSTTTRFLFHPRRVAALMRHFYTQALKDNKVMLKYIDILIPSQEKGGTLVQVNVNSPMMKPDPRKYGPDGNEIDITPDSRPDKS